MKVNSKALQFEWDSGNSNKNKLKHTVEDWECEEVFFDSKKVMFNDKLHSRNEQRFILLGKTKQERLLYIVFTTRKEKIRVISARDITKRKEIELYEKAS
jgi:uncharacterized DUF497 family protein